MRERTTRAEGTKVNGGRRITITMDEDLFFAVRKIATLNCRSMSDQIARYLHDIVTASEKTE